MFLSLIHILSVERLGEMCLELQEQGALNVNFVTPTHYAPEARAAVAWARERGLALPVVWNTSGYETVAAVRANEGTVCLLYTSCARQTTGTPSGSRASSWCW